MSFFNLRKRADHAEVTPQHGSDDAEATGVEALNHLQNFEKLHKLDPNLPLDELNDVGDILASGNIEKGVEVEATLLEENSPYPEVSETQLVLPINVSMLRLPITGPRRRKELRRRFASQHSPCLGYRHASLHRWLRSEHAVFITEPGYIRHDLCYPACCLSPWSWLGSHLP